tara:strand:+ start:1407 stop:1757 length:351 start_codon:yes stop_codon:yes gene_type:complete
MNTLPKELVHIILEYDGRIKYRNGEYINIIHRADQRYTNLIPVIEKKLHILKTWASRLHPPQNEDFYFEFEFEQEKKMGLCYASGGFSAAPYTQQDKIEITHFNFKNNIEQHRVYI